MTYRTFSIRFFFFRESQEKQQQSSYTAYTCCVLHYVYRFYGSRFRLSCSRKRGPKDLQYAVPSVGLILMHVLRVGFDRFFFVCDCCTLFWKWKQREWPVIDNNTSRHQLTLYRFSLSVSAVQIRASVTKVSSPNYWENWRRYYFGIWFLITRVGYNVYISCQEDFQVACLVWRFKGVRFQSIGYWYGAISRME